MISKRIIIGSILNNPELICLHTVKCFQVLPYNNNNCFQY